MAIGYGIGYRLKSSVSKSLVFKILKQYTSDNTDDIVVKRSVSKEKLLDIVAALYNSLPVTHPNNIIITNYKDDIEDIIEAEANNRIRFALDNAKIKDKPNIMLDVLRVFERLDPTIISGNVIIDMPQFWEEGIISGVLMMLSSGKYSNENRYKHNESIYRSMLSNINEWESNRFPSTTDKNYNYQDPADYFRMRR